MLAFLIIIIAICVSMVVAMICLAFQRISEDKKDATESDQFWHDIHECLDAIDERRNKK